MAHQIIQPNAALKPFLKEFWFLDFAKGSNGTPLSFAPSPEQCLYFYPKNPILSVLADGKIVKTPNNIIFGQTVSCNTAIIPDNYCMFKIQFQAGGFFKMFGIPMTHFADSFEESITVLGSPMKELQEQIVNARDFQEMVQLAETYFFRELRKIKFQKRPIDWVLNQKNLHYFSLDKLASDACLSSRQFERNFLERIGVSPKIYQRLMRFNHAMIIKKVLPEKKWIDITYDTGYFDQNHLLRDFKQFTGKNPTLFDFDKAVIY